MKERSEDSDTIKEGIQNAGARLAEVHLTVQTNQQATEAQAAQNQAELLSAMEGLDDKLGIHFSHVEKEAQRA